MLTSPDTSGSFPADSSDIILPVDLDSVLPSSSSSNLRPHMITLLLLSIPPEILPKAIRFLTRWRLQEPRSALPTVSVLALAEELYYAHPGRRIRWISKEYYEELEIDQRGGGSRITPTEDDDEANNEKDTFPGQYAHGLDASQLRRGCHIPRARTSNSNPTPTIKPISTTTHKAIPTTRKTISTSLISTKTPKSKSKSRPVAKPKSKPIIDSENIPPSQVPRRRPAAGKSRIPAPAPRVFGLHNA